MHPHCGTNNRTNGGHLRTPANQRWDRAPERPVNDIDGYFVAGSTESNSTHFVWRQLFRKYFRYARMTSLKMSKFNFSATISNINAQFAPVNKGLNSASIRLQERMKKIWFSPMTKNPIPTENSKTNGQHKWQVSRTITLLKFVEHELSPHMRF